MESTERAIEELRELGLTEYQAKCFVALSRVSSGTASELSELANVPRSRIYDVTESLHEQGLVEIQDGSPQAFRAVSPELAVTKLEREFQTHLDAVARALQEIPATQADDTSGGVWTVEGKHNVVERGQQLAADADEELFGLFTEEAVFTENCFRQAHDAIERSVRVILGSPDEELREELRDEFPAAIIWEPTLEWQTLSVTEGQVSRLVMADRDLIMIGTLGEEVTPGVYDENAIWGWGETNGVLLVLRQIVGSHLNEFDDGDDSVTVPL